MLPDPNEAPEAARAADALIKAARRWFVLTGLPIRRVVCPRGHARTPENTWTGDKQIQCRLCDAERHRAKHARARKTKEETP
ncbi:hypothetical protein [Actinocorallia aurantiaca]|uniref:HNH endonuclease n=1 Tax=Actinocorallia aurantiaca TaxID=46204 RepID=A0ABN3U7X6_9ACTN